MSTIGIYKITNKINGKVYIGQSVNIFKRWSVHGNMNRVTNKSQVISKAIHKYGIESFTFEVLELCTKELLNSREIYWVSKFNSYKVGYNATSGGDSPIESVTSKLTLENIKNIQNELQINVIPMTTMAANYNVSEGAIRAVNTGESWYNPDLNYPLRSGNLAYSTLNPKIVYTCISCGIQISKTKNSMCKPCQTTATRKVVWPSKVELIGKILKYSKVEVCDIYGVSDVTINTWCKKYKIFNTLNKSKRLIWLAHRDSNSNMTKCPTVAK